MRATLKELKAMSNLQLYRHWFFGRFPFESAKCGDCLTAHGSGRFCQRHPQITEAISVMKLDGITQEERRCEVLHEHLEELYAIRLYFDSLYRPAESEESHARTECDTKEAVTCEILKPTR